jgi:tRNA (Thr-GGU) A37 N-methylase
LKAGERTGSIPFFLKNSPYDQPREIKGSVYKILIKNTYMFEPDGPVLDIKPYFWEMCPQEGVCIPDWTANIMKEFHGQ